MSRPIVVNGQLNEKETLGWLNYNKIQSPTNLTDDDKGKLKAFLDKNKHSEKVYITKGGEISLVKYQYNSNYPQFKEFEGKYFSRLFKNYKSAWDISTGRYKPVEDPTPNNEDFLIIAEYDNPNYVKPAAFKNYDNRFVNGSNQYWHLNQPI